VARVAESFWLFRILYAGFAGLNEFSKLSALPYSPKMFAMNICIQDAIEPSFLRSTPFEDDLKKLSSDHPKLGGSQETFLRSTQFRTI